MVKKKINKENSSFNDNVQDNNKLSNNFQSINFNGINDENFKEALDLYEAINEGKIDLNPEEKNEIINELNLILDHFESSNIDLSKDTKYTSNAADAKDMDSDFNENQSSNNFNAISDDVPTVEYGNNFDESSGIEIKKELSADDEYDMVVSEEIVKRGKISNEKGDAIVEDDVSNMLSVDDALNDLIDVRDSVISEDKNLTSDNDLDDDYSIDYEDNLQEVYEVVEDDVSNMLSVDDALNDLIDDYSNEVAISANNISMEFKVSKDKIDTLKEYFIRTVKRNKSDSKFIRALDDVSFEIPKGDRVGIIGFNGAGKSTLLKVLAGVYDATEGTIETKGKIAPLLELGAGFDMNYTGKDNIFLNGAFLGYSEEFLKEKYDEILEFSELGDAINYHVKTYSSGMRAKLGFAIATIVEPDILILDEILSVGDIKFRKKSADKIRSLINSGITVLLVSHSVGQIRDLCNKAIWIDEGKLKMYGEVNEVCDAYIKAASNATKDQLENIQLN